MQELHQIIQTLDLLPNYNSRKEYLESICNNPTIEKYDLKRIACNVLMENNFIRSYYKYDLKINLDKFLNLFIKILQKLSIIKTDYKLQKHDQS